MPYKNEHAFRIKDPDQYESFARKNNEFGDGIHVIYGIKNDKSEVQSIRFSAKKWTFTAAKKWLKDHDWKYIKAEEATGEKGFDVKCQACGNTFDSTQEPEVGIGAIECPNCASKIDQEGKVLKVGTKNIFNRLIRRFYNA